MERNRHAKQHNEKWTATDRAERNHRIEIQNNQLAMPPNYWAASPASPAFSVESPGLKTSPYGGGSP